MGIRTAPIHALSVVYLISLVPCHFIPLDDAGNTLEALEMEGDESRTVSAVKKWLQGKISEIEAERSKKVLTNVGLKVPERTLRARRPDGLLETGTGTGTHQ